MSGPLIDVVSPGSAGRSGGRPEDVPAHRAVAASAPSSTGSAGSPVRVVVVGAGGLAGGELIERLLEHPAAELVGLFGSERIEPGEEPAVEALHPRLAGRIHERVQRADVAAIAACRPHAIMLAVPHGASADLVPALLAATDAVVLDLSGTFRLGSLERTVRHYGVAPAEDLVAQAVYGLVELAREDLRPGPAASRLIAVPGCYPTASILPLRPLAEAGRLADGRVAISAASGVSGAGRGANERTSFCNVSFQPYGIGNHRHAPEIELHAGVGVSFVPHLGAWDRGIIATIHARLEPGTTADDVRATWSERVASPFVRVLPDGAWPAITDVRGTNRCDMAAHVEPDGTAVLVSAIDNLLKGAAGQAIQCLNVRFGLDETAGLPGAMRTMPARVTAAATAAGGAT